MSRIVCLILSAVILQGCAYLKGKKAIIKNRDMAYVSAHASQPLQIPTGISSAAFGDELTIPPVSKPWNGNPPSLVPPAQK